jgi:hypothetical protein
MTLVVGLVDELGIFPGRYYFTMIFHAYYHLGDEQ